MENFEDYSQFFWNLASNYLSECAHNACISPFSLYIPLSAVALGAEGSSRAEFDRALLKRAEHSMVNTIKELCKFVESWPVLMDNSIQLTGKYVLAPRYEELLKDNFENLINIKIAGGEEDSITIENHTKFQDKWMIKFSEITAPFYVEPYRINNKDGTEGVSIPFLERKACTINVKETSDYLSISIPFCRGCHIVFAMPVGISPKEFAKNEDFLKSSLTLSPNLQGNPISKKLPKYDLFLPSFEINNGIKCNSLLMSMGIKRAFDQMESGLSTMIGRGNEPYIKDVEQQVTVKVDTDGVAAEAITRIFLLPTVGGISSAVPKSLRLDHPFFFAIWLGEPVQIPLFIGTFQEPVNRLS